MTKVGLVFDDGFTASCLKIASIFEARGLSATFAVLVDHTGFMPNFPKGDFVLWNELQARGHTIHPHGYDHSDLSQLPYAEAVDKIDACLLYFSENLSGFDASQCVYHTTYNRSTPKIETYLLSKVRAIRSTGLKGQVGSGVNGRDELERRILSCSWHGPAHCDSHLLEALHLAEKQRPTLFLYMMHGLDDEGWGPIHTPALESALDFILSSTHLSYTPLKEKIIGSCK